MLVEECVYGREIECAVLGNDHPQASLPGEIIPTHPFYSYEAKYLDQHGADCIIPALLCPKKIEEVKQLAIQVFQLLRCEGMARVDCFLKQDGTLLINEVNTIPGFTAVSLYPKLWEASGLSFSHLLDQLIELAIARYQRKKRFRKEMGHWEGDGSECLSETLGIQKHLAFKEGEVDFQAMDCWSKIDEMQKHTPICGGRIQPF